MPLLLILFVVENVLFGDRAVLRYAILRTDAATLAFNLTMLFDHPLMNALARATGWTGLKAGSFGSAAQLWTVVIEWWIYVTFGILAFLVATRRPLDLRTAAWLAFAAIVPAFALVKGNGLIVAWIVGMLVRLGQAPLARLRRDVLATLSVGSGALAAAALFLGSLNFYSSVVAGLFSFSVLALYLAIDPRHLDPQRWRLHRLFEGLSAISYSVYLVHLSVMLWILAKAPELTGRPATFIGLVIAANVAAVLFYFAFERHYVAVRRYLSRRLDAPRLAAERLRAP